MKTKTLLLLTPVAALLALTACNTTPELKNRPGFLSTYNHLQQVDPTTWRYVSPVLLGQCNKFFVSPVKVLFNDIDGKPVTAEQRQRSSDFIRQALIQGISQRYPVVMEPGPDVAEVRVALTDAYRKGGKVGLSLEGEILDNSNTQVGAVMRSEMSELYVANWENRATAKEMVEKWVQRLCQTIDESKRR
jgi:hypothetical protein